MCNTNNNEVDTSIQKGKKRKADFDEFDEIFVPPKRISPFLNTPKEKKEERKRVLKTSIQKLKHVDDPEAFLRRSVLINNTIKRLQKEIREEKTKQPKYGMKNKGMEYALLASNCLVNSYMYDDPFICNVHEKITDDMTETLMSNLRDKLVDSTDTEEEVEQTVLAEPEVENRLVSSELSKCNCSSRALCPQCNSNSNYNNNDNNNTASVICSIELPLQTHEHLENQPEASDKTLGGHRYQSLENTDSQQHTERTLCTSQNDNKTVHVSESFIINQTVLPCSNRLDINMIIEPEVTSHSDIKSSAEYSRSHPVFLDGIYAY